MLCSLETVNQSFASMTLTCMFFQLSLFFLALENINALEKNERHLCNYDVLRCNGWI